MFTEKNIIVTWDFTAVSDYAIAHAIKMAQAFDKDIKLLHVIKKESEKKEIEEKLQKTVIEIQKTHSFLPSYEIIVGDIFHSIGDYTSDSENDVGFVVMGTHGMRGMQKLTGSWALKVIASSVVPFIVVQDKPNEKQFSNIVLPLDFKDDNKEKLVWAIHLAQYFSIKIHLFKELVDDKYYLKKINNNLTFAKKYLVKYGINHEIHTAEKKSNFETQLIDFTNQINADFILVMTTKKIGFTDYVFGTSEQNIIANNAKIPIMYVNPRNDLMRSSF